MISYFSEDIRSRAKEVGAKFVLTDADRAPRVLESVKSLDFVQEVFVTTQFQGCTPFHHLMEEPINGRLMILLINNKLNDLF